MTTTMRHSRTHTRGGRRGPAVTDRAAHPQGVRGRKRERGLALVTVLIVIALTLVISNEFGTSTNTDMIAAANYRDEMRAHFLARSAQNLGELVIQVQAQVDKARAQIGPVQITDYADQLILPFCGDNEQVQDAVGFSTRDMVGLGAEVGTCGFNGPFETEDNKINLNCANNPAMAPIIKSALEALFYFPAYDPIFDEPDAEGWRRDRQMQVTAILDYIDRDFVRGVAQAGGGASEDYGYESLKDRYEAKNTYVDTLGEIKLVRGVDDRFWSVFGDAFTVYGDCKINLAAVTNPQLIAAVLMLSVPQDKQNQPTYLDPRKLFMLAGLVAKARQFGQTFDKADEFVSFVRDPMSSVSNIAGAGGMAGGAAGQALSQGLGLPPGERVGLEIDAKLLAQVATFEARRTYRIEAWGEIERKASLFPPIRKTITGVWNTRVVPSNIRRPQTHRGAWVFLRED
jgi:general secretion pathway protein K